MIKVKDTFSGISSLFYKGDFSMEQWEVYADAIYGS